MRSGVGRVLLLATLTVLMLGTVSAQSFFDGFEDGDISEYTGDTGSFSVSSSNSYEGVYSLHAQNDGNGNDNLIHSSREFGPEMKAVFYADRTQGYGGLRYGGTESSSYLLDFREGKWTLFTPSGNSYDGPSFSSISGYQKYIVNWYENGTHSFRVVDPSNGDSLASFSVNNENNVGKGIIAFRTYGSGADIYYDSLEISVFNTAPSIDSVKTEPSSWTLNSDINVSADVSDSDGTVSSVEADVWENGTQIVNNASLSDSDSDGEWNVSDLFTVDESDVYYNYTLTATDDDGATDTFSESQLIKDKPPKFTVEKPSNSTGFDYDRDWKIRVEKDGDNVPGEDITCEIYNNGNITDTVVLEEGDTSNNSASGTHRNDLGSHTFKSSCSDPNGNTRNKSVSYTIDILEEGSSSSEQVVYEGVSYFYDSSVKLGDMVNSVKPILNWSGETRAGSNISSSGDISTEFLTPIVENNGSSKTWNYSYEIDYTDYNGDNASMTKTGNSNDVRVDWNIHSFQVSDVNKVIEDQPFNPSLDYTVETTPHNIDISYSTNYNGSTESGEDPVFRGELSNSDNKAVSSIDSTLTLTLNNDSRSLTGSASQTSYRKILTDCSNDEYGVLGDKALQFNFYDESNRTTLLDADVEYNLDITADNSSHTRNYAFTRSGEKLDTCIYPSWAEYSATGPIGFEATVNGTTYPDRRYEVTNMEVNNDSETIDFYLLSEQYAEPIYFQVVDQSGSPVENARISFLRYFIGEDSYLTVAKSVTDSQGIATTYLRVNEIYYKFLISDQEGNLLLESERQIITCQTIPCEKAISIEGGLDKNYEVRQGFTYSVDENFDEDGNVTSIQATVSHEDDYQPDVSFVLRETGTLGGNSTICDVDEVGSDVSIVCQFDEPVNGRSFEYVLKGSADGRTYTLDTGVFDYSEGLFGGNTEYLGFIVFLLFALLGLRSPSASIMFSFFGVGVAWAFGLISVGVASIASLGFVALIYILSNRT
jgi:hypothetical protein